MGTAGLWLGHAQPEHKVELRLHGSGGNIILASNCMASGRRAWEHWVGIWALLLHEPRVLAHLWRG